MDKLLIALFVFGWIAGVQATGFALEPSIQEQTNEFHLRLQTPNLLQDVTGDRFTSGFGFALRFASSAEGVVLSVETESDDAVPSLTAGPRFNLASRLTLGGLTALGSSIVIWGTTVGLLVITGEFLLSTLYILAVFPIMAIIGAGLAATLFGVPAAVWWVGNRLGGKGDYWPTFEVWTAAVAIMSFVVMPGVGYLLESGRVGKAMAFPLGVTAFTALFLAPAMRYESSSHRNRERNRQRNLRQRDYQVGLKPFIAPQLEAGAHGVALTFQGRF